jgi:uncharacterized protein
MLQKKQFIVGRKDEKAILKRIIEDNAAKFLAVYGRRRVGKTYLIKTYFNSLMGFELSGQKEGDLQEQLINFSRQYQAFFNQVIATPTSWQDAFYLIQKAITRKRTTKKIVLFFDELPWLARPKSKFLHALDYFWNNFAQYQKNIVVVVCGSSASWIIEKIINNKGGLHNRITDILKLEPFTLYETELFLKYKSLNLDRFTILQLYMVLGGIPHYLNAIQKGESMAQAIDRLCFAKNGLLRNEFDNLYEALFSNASLHTNVIRLLAKRKIGLTRKAIIQGSGISNGGSVTRLLNELEESGFITKYLPFGKQQRESLYRLTDYYTLFYFHYIENSKSLTKGSWEKQYQLPTWKTYSGFAFENVCLQHTLQIQKALGISGVYVEQSSWFSKTAQIDLLYDRSDNVITIGECKFYKGAYALTHHDVKNIQHKINSFQTETATDKSIFVALVTVKGIIKNKYSSSLIDHCVDMRHLFEDEIENL